MGTIAPTDKQKDKKGDISARLKVILHIHNQSVNYS